MLNIDPIGAGMLFVMAIVGIGALIVGVAFLKKQGGAGQSDVLGEIEQAAEGVVHRQSRAKSHGELLDQFEGITSTLVKGGYLTQADADAMTTKVATGLITHKAPSEVVAT